MSKQFPTQAQFLKTCRFGLTSPVFGEKKAGQCKRWVRQMQEGAGVPLWFRCPTGIDAKEAADWYRHEHPDLIVTSGLPGDIYFWEKGHGPHGHVMVREEGNTLIGNFKGHGTSVDGDARGSYAMDPKDPPTIIIRTWRKKE